MGAENRRLGFIFVERIEWSIGYLVSVGRKSALGGKDKDFTCDMERLKVGSRDCDRHQVVWEAYEWFTLCF